MTSMMDDVQTQLRMTNCPTNAAVGDITLWNWCQSMERFCWFMCSIIFILHLTCVSRRCYWLLAILTKWCSMISNWSKNSELPEVIWAQMERWLKHRHGWLINHQWAGQYLDGWPAMNTKCLVPLQFLPDLILWSIENRSHGSPVLVPPETQ